MADFKTAYNTYVLPWEGGYSAPIPGDSGGETYAGIARVYNPSFADLWAAIDAKKKRGPIPHNSKFPELQPMVERFYRNLWNKYRLDEIKSQDIANLLFDYNVNSGPGSATKNGGVSAIQKIVGALPDGKMGAVTIAKINALPAGKVYNALKQQRRDFLIAIGQQPDKQKFLKGWLARVDSFPTLTVGLGLAGILIAVVVGYIMLNKM